jgi:hypothetical protein
MGLSDCEEGKRLLKAAAKPNRESAVREAFVQHINRCHVCNDYWNATNCNLTHESNLKNSNSQATPSKLPASNG